jgi:hypothetical protein
VAEFLKYFLQSFLAFRIISTCADMAQLVEHNLAKVGVAGSSPVVRSIENKPANHIRTGFFSGEVAKW